MTNENKSVSPETEKLKLERFKVWGRIVTVAITVLFGSGLGGYINYSLQKRQLEQQKLLNDAELQLQNAKSEADRRQAEMKYLGDFITYALADDHKKRLRFAEYFATLTISSELQSKWKDYRDGIIKTMEDLEAKEKELFTARKTGEEEAVKKLETDVARLQAQLAPLPGKSEVYLSYDIVSKLLDKYMKPKNYTSNEFELQNNGKVIYDKATGLMWQKSGSDSPVTYDEAKTYIDVLNREHFAGYSDWRLPTLKEAISLLEPPPPVNDGLYIDMLFDKKQKWIWTSDLYSTLSAWVVFFNDGDCDGCPIGGDWNRYVRAVR